jgi:1-acyl-sn-glycerol-3-phosphate acyltransferase
MTQAEAYVPAARGGRLVGPEAVLAEAVHRPSDRWYALLRACLRLYAVTCVEAIDVHAQAALPPQPKIIAANHPNMTDALLLPSIFADRLCVLGQANGFSLPVLGPLLARAGHLPVLRGRFDLVLRAARQRLAQGFSLVIFPEGRLNHGGPLYRGRLGAVRLALETGAPIVPVGFHVPARHTHAVRLQVDGLPTVGRWQVGGRCTVAIGPAWRPDQETGCGAPAQARRLTDALMAQIAALARAAEALAGGRGAEGALAA